MKEKHGVDTAEDYINFVPSQSHDQTNKHPNSASLKLYITSSTKSALENAQLSAP